MTDTPGIEKFYGAAILLLRWWVLGWTREELAEESGVSAASIYNYEKGKTAPGLERRKKIAGISRVTIAWGPSVGPMRATIAKMGVRLASEDKCQEKMR